MNIIKNLKINNKNLFKTIKLNNKNLLKNIKLNYKKNNIKYIFNNNT